ncbi:MAG: response regulator [Actinomycetota bacterium]|nr:response regulator [Actinomycetota bacterium]
MARILIVDDNADIRRLIGTILTPTDHELMFAEDGGKALEIVKKRSPELVILDVMMPNMDGFMVLKQMRVAGLRDSTRVLMLTAKSTESDWVRGYKLGADAYLTKPFDPDELMSFVDELFSMTKDRLRERREEELHRAQMLSRLESIFQS